MSSQAQLTANRANAQHSTGPVTPEGKSKSSLNAVKTGLTGRTVLLPTDDAAAYQSHIDRFFAEYKPVTDREKELTQSLADTQWRLDRIPVLEAGIYARGHREFASQFESEPATTRAALIQTETFLSYRKELNNLSIQESRLLRRFAADREELTQSIQSRTKKRNADLNRGLSLFRQPLESGDDFNPAEFGFEFSSEELLAYHSDFHKLEALKKGQYFGVSPKKAA